MVTGEKRAHTSAPHPNAIALIRAMKHLETTGQLLEKDDCGNLGSLSDDYDALVEAFQENGLEGYERAKKAIFKDNSRLAIAYATYTPGEGHTAQEQQEEGFTTGKKGQKVFITLSEEDIETLPDIEWLIAGILQCQTVSLVAGDGNTGKTFIVLDLCMHIARGISWQGRRVKQGDVLYIYAEGKLGLKPRIQAWKKHYQKPSSPHMHFIPRPVHLLNNRQVLCDTIEAFTQTPVLVVVDTFSMCASGVKENDNSDVEPYIKVAREIKERYGCHVLIVHHSGKGNNGNNIRGASVFRDNTDTVMYVSRADKLSPIVLQCEKQRDGGFFPPMRLRLHPVDLGFNKYMEEITSCVPVPTNEAPDTGLAPNQELLLTALGNDTLTYTQWQKKAEELGVKKSTFNHAKTQLINRGHVMKTGDDSKLFIRVGNADQTGGQTDV